MNFLEMAASGWPGAIVAVALIAATAYVIGKIIDWLD